jgi:2-polyprenyl-3-methyl-5-hydroxy-6-metoxy-1,4-benzoquinol methylase
VETEDDVTEREADLASRYYTQLAAAFVRGQLADMPDLADELAVAYGRARGLRLHKFKQQAELPRVRRVLGWLHGLAPASLLDIGSGRGTFLWPLLHEFPHLEVTALDLNPQRVADLDAVRRGGLAKLRVLQMDTTQIALPDKSVDVVTALEVLEHLPQPQLAAHEAVRLARRFVLVSVPSKADDNPEHIQLFNRVSLETLLRQAGAQSVKIEYVLNHMIAVAKV